jgi:hypothetical protein
VPEDDHGDLRLAIRRHTDRCFHRVEEVIEGKLGGYIVDGILIPREDVAEVVELDADGSPLPRCARNDEMTKLE